MFPSEHGDKHATVDADEKDDDPPDPPRNFTLAQLSQFDGTADAKSGQAKDVYLSINGIVFDVSKGRNFYGPGGPYEKVRSHVVGNGLCNERAHCQARRGRWYYIV
jgi:predicted heme/steroid binding protein